jgi:hypothetical protein
MRTASKKGPGLALLVVADYLLIWLKNNCQINLERSPDNGLLSLFPNVKGNRSATGPSPGVFLYIEIMRRHSGIEYQVIAFLTDYLCSGYGQIRNA